MLTKNSLITGGAVLGATDLLPTVEYVLGGCKGPIPTSVASLIATVLAAGLHAAIERISGSNGNGQASAQQP
ncbi:MAG: hypothetical protein ACTHKE_03375 [Sphingomicrobium sp.]